MPKNSLIDQSLAAKQSETTTNGDGFGIGWYGSRDEPGIYRDVRPAWNDANLRTLAAQIESRLFFAHIRAATGTAVQRTNCHPFRYRNWLFVHNGGIVGFPDIKRELVLAIEPVLPCKVDSPARGCRPFSLTLRKRCGNTTPPPAMTLRNS